MPEFQYPPFFMIFLAVIVLGFSRNLETLFKFLIFFVKKYPYWFDGMLGLIPKIKILLFVKNFLFFFISKLNLLIFSINWSEEKKIIGWLIGISGINTEERTAGPVFFFTGSKTIL